MDKLKLVRSVIIHMLYAIYYSVLLWRLGVILDISFEEFSKTGMIVGGVLACIAFAIIQFIIAYQSVFKK